MTPRTDNFIRLFAAAALCWVVLTGCARDRVVDTERSEALLREAHMEASVFNYNRAYELYSGSRAIAEVGSDQWVEATFGAATSGWHRLPPNRASIVEARTLFEELVKRLTTDSPYLPRALLSLGRMHEQVNFPGDTEDVNTARGYYTRVMEEWENTIFADEAAGRFAASALHDYRDPEAVREGLERLERYLERRTDSPIANILWYFLGDKYWHYLEDAEKAFASFERAIALGLVERARAWHTYWRMAWMAERYLDDPLGAAVYYAKIVEETPRSPRVHESLAAYARLREQFPDELPEIKRTLLPHEIADE
ncbi:MAG: hypothetical protein JJU00_08825 [Opitutales bacterium]|nr:hypothetical protein [Opitutales bacterium]